MKKSNLLSLLAVTVILASFMSSVAFGAAGQPLARISAIIEKDKKVEKSSDGSHYRAAARQWAPLAGHSEIFSDDEIKTGSSQLVLQYADGSGETLLQARTQIKLSIPPRAKGKTALLKIGEIFNRVKGNFEVMGSGINGAVEGTEFYTAVKEGKATFVVLDGKVRVTSKQEAVIVKRLEMTEGGPALPPLAPTKAPEETIRYIVKWVTRVKTITVTRISAQPYFKTAEERDRTFNQYSLLAAMEPNNAVAQCELGNVYLDWQDYPKAIEYFKKAISLDNKNASAHNNIGLVYSQQGSYDLATEHYLKAISLNPKSAQSYNNLAMVYDQKGDREAAIMNFKKAVEIDQRFAAAYNNMGMVYFKTDHYEQAEEVFDKAISLDPKFASPHNNLGNVYARRGDYEAAEKAFKSH